MTERAKMLTGELYDPLDPELVSARARARDICQRLNASRETDIDLRRSLAMELFGKGGDSVWMHPPFYCDYGYNIQLGERVFFNFNCIVLDAAPVIIGDYAQFGPGVQLLTSTHPLDSTLRRKQEYAMSIEVGDNSWIGAGALVLPGVKIGKRTVIGAGSVVTRSIPDDVIAVGNPCRVVRSLGSGDVSET